MTWARVKRWLALHPWITFTPLIVLGTVAPLIVAVTVLITVTSTSPPSPLGLLHPLVVTPVVLMVVYYVAAGGWGCWIGCLRARAGLPVIGEARMQVMLGWLIAVGMATLSMPVVGTLFAVFLGAVPVAALFIGLLVAQRIARRKIAEGRWESTTPLTPATTATPFFPTARPVESAKANQETAP